MEAAAGEDDCRSEAPSVTDPSPKLGPSGEPDAPSELGGDDVEENSVDAADQSRARTGSHSCADAPEETQSGGGDGPGSVAGEPCDTDMDSRSCVPPESAAGDASNCQESAGGSDAPEGAAAEESAQDAPTSAASNADAPPTADSASGIIKRKAPAKVTAATLKKQKRLMIPSSPAVRRDMLPPPPPFPGSDVGASSSSAAADADAATEPSELDKLRRELETLREQYGQQRRKLQTSARATNEGKLALAEVLKRLAQREFVEENDRMQAATFRFGHCRQTHLGLGLNQNTWSGGYDEEEINRVRARIEEDRQNIARERVMLNKTDDDDKLERQDILKHRAAYLTKEEQAIKEREQRLQVDRQMHLKRQQRLEMARRSNFGDFPKMRERYQLLNMIGRGGFSEVYRAFDLESNAYCAVKIHELGKDMSEVQRQNYIRRAMREYEIQKGLKHPKVVTLQDCFPISTRAFGTILELCNGDTLDEYMKRYGVLGEREARGIVIQVLSGLRYLNCNETGNKIIHYDLKPGNLFFHCGEVKIADFGLSKIVHHSNPGESIDLTSHGAGTYWYLPPECMVIEANQGEVPKISNKVDVWSTGVIFFELLFGKRPYGHGQSQEALRRSAVAQGFDSVTLPAAPKVTPECARYLKRLLCLSKDNRPDVIEALSDPYIRGVKKDKTKSNMPDSDAVPAQASAPQEAEAFVRQESG